MKKYIVDKCKEEPKLFYIDLLMEKIKQRKYN